MSSFDPFFNFGPGGTRRFARNSGRSLTGDAVGTIRYPSPFFDIAHTYLPSSFKTMLRWCRYYFLTNPLINAVCYKMAEYPVTDLIFDTDNAQLLKKWKNFFGKTIKFKKFEVEVGLDYNCYGNCFVSIFYPFHKYLTCKRCTYSSRVEKQKYTFREFAFHGACNKCGHYGEFTVKDHHVRSMRDIRMIRWNPEQISIRHNEATGENMYYYTIPGTLRNDLQMGKRHVLERTPQAFIEAVRKNKALLFNRDNIYHLKRPTIAQKDKGWGLPMILPVLKDTFYLQILRKAQEAIAIEHVVPMRVLFPQMASGTSDPYATVNLVGWKLKVEQEILRWRLDNNYIPILPIPIGQQTLGGDGRALMLAQEYRVWSEQIVAGMGVPIEFVFGGMQYSGSNVSLRILENHFLDYKADHHALVQDFIMPNVGAFMGWEPVDTHFRKFKMADDLQRSAFNLQLNQAGKISDHSLLEESDWNSSLEQERISGEQRKQRENQRRQAIDQASIQGEAQLVMQRYQIRGQKALEENMPQQEGPLTAPPGEAQQQGMALAGIPGQASPGAMGQDQLAQGEMATAGGQTPPMDNPGMLQQMQQEQQAEGPGPMPAGTESPIGVQQVNGQPAESAPPVSLDIRQVATKIAAWLDQMPDAEKQPHLVALQAQNPQLHAMVAAALGQRGGAHQSSAAMPMPEQRSPRRGPEAIMM